MHEMFPATQPALSASTSSGVQRVLLVGDSGVGKSVFLNLLATHLHSGRAALPTERITSTVGFRVEVVTFPSHGGSPSAMRPAPIRALEILEVGGNRNFPVACRTAAYFHQQAGANGSSVQALVSAVVFMYDTSLPSSAAAAGAWYKELVECGALDACRSFLLIGVVGSCNATMCTARERNGGGLSARQHPPSLISRLCQWFVMFCAVIQDPSQYLASFTGGVAPPLVRIAVAVVRAVVAVEQLLLVLCSYILFGGGQRTVSMSQQPLPVSKTLEIIRNDSRCVAEVQSLSLTPDGFSDDCSEVLQFLNSVVS